MRQGWSRYSRTVAVGLSLSKEARRVSKQQQLADKREQRAKVMRRRCNQETNDTKCKELATASMSQRKRSSSEFELLWTRVMPSARCSCGASNGAGSRWCLPIRSALSGLRGKPEEAVLQPKRKRAPIRWTCYHGQTCKMLCNMR